MGCPVAFSGVSPLPVPVGSMVDWEFRPDFRRRSFARGIPDTGTSLPLSAFGLGSRSLGRPRRPFLPGLP